MIKLPVKSTGKWSRIRFNLKTVDTCGVSNTCTLLWCVPCQCSSFIGLLQFYCSVISIQSLKVCGNPLHRLDVSSKLVIFLVSETERVVDLGTLCGRLTSGTSNLLSVKEDKRNKVTPGTSQFLFFSRIALVLLFYIILLLVYLTSDKTLMPHNRICYNTRMQINKWINEYITLIMLLYCSCITLVLPSYFSCITLKLLSYYSCIALVLLSYCSRISLVSLSYYSCPCNTLVLLSYCSCIVLVLPLYYSRITLVLFLYYSCITLVLLSYYSCITLVLLLYYSRITLVLLSYFSRNTLILLLYYSHITLVITLILLSLYYFHCSL